MALVRAERRKSQQMSQSQERETHIKLSQTNRSGEIQRECRWSIQFQKGYGYMDVYKKTLTLLGNICAYVNRAYNHATSDLFEASSCPQQQQPPYPFSPSFSHFFLVSLFSVFLIVSVSRRKKETMDPPIHSPPLSFSQSSRLRSLFGRVSMSQSNPGISGSFENDRARSGL